jgi:hypothetical protein
MCSLRCRVTMAGAVLVLGSLFLPRGRAARALVCPILPPSIADRVVACIPDSRVQDLLRLAASARPALQADILLRLVESGRLTKRTDRRALILRAFMLTDTLPLETYSTPPTAAGLVDGAAQFSARAARELAIDRLSLQCRAVGMFLDFDPGEGQQLLKGLRLPERRDDGCDEHGVLDYTRYYEILHRYRKATNADHWKDLPSPLGHFTSTAELGPILHLLSDPSVSCGQLPDAVQLLAAALPRISDGDRAYSAMLLYSRFPESLTEFLRRSDQCHTEIRPLLEALQAYVLRHVMAPRCADAFRSHPQQTQEWRVINLLNGASANLGMPPITAAQLRDIPDLAPEHSDALETEAANRYMVPLHIILYRNGELPYSARERAAPEWRRKLDAMLGVIDAAPAQSAFEQHWRLTALQQVLDKCSDEYCRERILDAIFKSLSPNAVETSPVLFAHGIGALVQAAEYGEADYVREVSLRSSNRLLYLYSSIVP